MAITDRLDPTESLSISHDDLDRLIQVGKGAPGDVALPIEDYPYDQEGNRLASSLCNLCTAKDHN